jgi:hypothetical protein
MMPPLSNTNFLTAKAQRRKGYAKENKKQGMSGRLFAKPAIWSIPVRAPPRCVGYLLRLRLVSFA